MTHSYLALLLAACSFWRVMDPVLDTDSSWSGSIAKKCEFIHSALSFVFACPAFDFWGASPNVLLGY